jgi:hypothetical protein
MVRYVRVCVGRREHGEVCMWGHWTGEHMVRYVCGGRRRHGEVCMWGLEKTW